MNDKLYFVKGRDLDFVIQECPVCHRISKFNFIGVQEGSRSIKDYKIYDCSECNSTVNLGLEFRELKNA